MKHKSKVLLVLFSLVLLVGSMLPVLTACKTIYTIRIENGTEQILTIYYDVGGTGYFVTLGDVKPDEHIYTPDFNIDFGYCQIDAKNVESEIVFSREYDWWELDDMDWTVVITPPEMGVQRNEQKVWE
jgi:hypothetical protein